MEKVLQRSAEKAFYAFKDLIKDVKLTHTLKAEFSMQQGQEIIETETRSIKVIFLQGQRGNKITAGYEKMAVSLKKICGVVSPGDRLEYEGKVWVALDPVMDDGFTVEISLVSESAYGQA